MNPIHLQYISQEPTLTHRVPFLFKLLDRFTPKYRDEVLERVCLAFTDDSDWAEPGAWEEKRYLIFKNRYYEATKRIDCEKYVVFALVSYVLTLSYIRGRADRFDGLIKRHEKGLRLELEALGESCRAAREQELIRDHEETKMNLAKEAEACKEAYDAFCRDVVQVLCTRVEYIEDLEKM